MLCAFIKPSDDAACECQILQVVDRIWIQEEDYTSVIRDVILQVDEISSVGLGGIKALMTIHAVGEKDLSGSLADPDCFLNHRSRAGLFAVESPFAPIDGSTSPETDEAKISQYQFSNITVFRSVETELEEYLDAHLLSWTFPRQLVHGERAMLRTAFRVPSHLDVDDVADCQYLRLKYFTPRKIPRACKMVDLPQWEVPIVLEHGGVQCGLDVAVFVPSSLAVGKTSPDPHDTQTDRRGVDGEYGPHYMQYVWHAKDFVDGPLRANETRLRIDLTGITRQYWTVRHVQELRGQVGELREASEVQKKESRLAIALAIIGIVLTLAITMWQASTLQTTSGVEARTPDLLEAPSTTATP
jgi:hypothetical protein